MANNKINITELSSEIAAKSGVKASDVRSFLISLNAIIRDALNSGENVKIGGFGTFKVITTEPRKSIDVNTGAEITIGSYRKVTFSPEQSVKQLVNEQFADLPVVDVDENFELQAASDEEEDINVARIIDGEGDAGMQTPDVALATESALDEIKNLLAEINGGKAEETAESPMEQNTENPAVTEPAATSVSESAEAKQPESQPEASEVKEEKAEEKKAAKKSTPLWKIALLLIVIFVVVFGLFYLLLIKHIEKWTEQYVDPAQERIDERINERMAAPVAEPLSATEENNTVEPQAEESEAKPVVATKTKPQKPAVVAKTAPDAAVQLTDVEKTIAEAPVRTTEKVIEGSRLTQISRRHYRHPDFWVYIYLANKDKFPRGPHNVVTGTVLNIPDLPSELTDPKSEQAVAKAKALQEGL